MKNDWQKVMFTAECDPDGTGWCHVRNIDPAECSCIGPTQEGVEYREIGGVLYGRQLMMVRCDSFNDDRQCGLPAGHDGDHTVLIPSDAPWFPISREIQGEEFPADLADQVQTPNPLVRQGLTNTLLAELEWNKEEVKRLRGIIARVVMNDDMLAECLTQGDMERSAEILDTFTDECAAEVASWKREVPKP